MYWRILEVKMSAIHWHILEVRTTTRRLLFCEQISYDAEGVISHNVPRQAEENCTVSSLLPACTRHGHQHRVTVTRGYIDTFRLSW